MKVVFLPVSMIEKPKSGICVYFSKISFFFKGWGRGKKKAHNIHYQAPRYCLAVILSITILPSLHFFLFMLQDLFLATSGTEKRSSEETQHPQHRGTCTVVEPQHPCDRDSAKTVAEAPAWSPSSMRP